MITRIAVVPHPPLLVPELVPGAVESTEPVREACLTAARGLARAARTWIAVGAADRFWTIEPGSCGTFAGFGVDVRVALSSSSAKHPSTPTRLPLPALVAGWLRERAGAESVRVELVPADATVADCVAVGERIAAGADGDPGRDVALLVLGDGSSRHTSAAPGWLDERAGPFDAHVSAALASADAEALLGLDPELAAELGARGRAAWQVLAGFAVRRPGWRARLPYSRAPFGVAYHVAEWERA